MKLYQFPCGCTLPIISDDPFRLQAILNVEELPLECSRTWDMICEGFTKGCFQIESSLGQTWASKLKPRNIEELSDLIALIRPGAIEVFLDDGKNITQHYEMRKNGEESIEYFHPALEEILKPTLGLLIYQEQSTKIAEKLGGFDLQRADWLRKAIGKKDVNLMAKVYEIFMEGCKNTKVVNEEEAEEIFGWIRKSARYQFNKSHSVSYAYNSYLTAYYKAHTKRAFFTSWLSHAQDKQDTYDEMSELINDAKSQGIEVCVPDFRRHNSHFQLVGDQICFGMLDIKGLGKSIIDKIIKKIVELNLKLGPPEKWSWTQFLIYFSQYVSKTAIQHLIKAGSLDYFKVSRTRMLFEYNEIYSTLTKREQTFIENNYNGEKLLELLIILCAGPTGREGGIATSRRQEKVQGLIQHLQKPPYDLDSDMIQWKAAVEEFLMGASITCHQVDAHDTFQANCTCYEFMHNLNHQKSIYIAGSVDRINRITTRHGDPMAFVTISDRTGSLGSVVLFPKKWKEYEDKIEEKTVHLFRGDRGRQKYSLIIDKILKIS